MTDNRDPEAFLPLSDLALHVMLALGDGPLHGYGVKTRGLREYGNLLTTADSMAWSYNARRHPPLPGCTHRSCSNCLRWALRWRRNIVSCDRFRFWGRACDCAACNTETPAVVDAVAA